MKFIASFLLAAAAVAKAQEPPQLRGATQEQDLQVLEDPKSVEVKTDQILAGQSGQSRRKFIKYESSHWEKLWLEFGDQWSNAKQICGVLLNDQPQFVHDFINATCTSRYLPPNDNWCIIDDEYRPLFYNSANRDTFQLTWEAPLPRDAKISKPQPVVPTKQQEHIFSKFTFLDEVTGEEYVRTVRGYAAAG